MIQCTIQTLCGRCEQCDLNRHRGSLIGAHTTTRGTKQKQKQKQKSVFSSILHGVAILLFTLVALVTTGCSVRPANDVELPRDSFALVKITADVVFARICNDTVESTTPGVRECSVTKLSSLNVIGSGVVVDVSRRYDDVSYVMTAAHVCLAKDVYERTIENLATDNGLTVDEFIYTTPPRLTVDTRLDHDVTAKIVVLYPARDLCVVGVSGMETVPYVRDVGTSMRRPPPVTSAKVSTRHPERGDKVWTLSAPMGLWQDDLLNKFSGYYSGEYTCRAAEVDTFAISCTPGQSTWAVYTTPATKGSSGGPIFDSTGRVIGIISMVPSTFNNITYATKLTDIRRILDELVSNEDVVQGLDTSSPDMFVDGYIIVTDQ